MARTLSFVKGKGSISHNNRDFIANNVDKDRIAWNANYIQQPLKEAYDQLFGEAITAFNAKQKRKDRKIEDYINKIKNSGNGEKTFYETVIQIGKMTDSGVVDEEGNITEIAKVAKAILDEYVKTFQKRNPNLYLFNAVLHMDEATPHLHLDYIPIAHGYNNGLSVRNSLTKGLQEQGIAPAVSKKDNETTHWQKREREYLSKLCRDHEIDIEVIGVNRDNYTIPEYKAAMKAKEEAEAEIEILQAEKQEAENMIASVDEEIHDGMEEIIDQKKVLEEINQQLSEKKKSCKGYEEKIDKVLAARKPVEQEAKAMRAQAVVSNSMFGKETVVKIPEQVFERLMDRYVAVGTMEQLSDSYEKKISSMLARIDKLNLVVKNLKNLAHKYEKFVEIKGLTEMFIEYIRPKTIKEQLEEKDNIVEIKKDEGCRVKRKRQDVVI